MKIYTDYAKQFDEKCEAITSWINSTLKNYAKKHTLNQGEVEHILDYLAHTKKDIYGMQYDAAKLNSEKWVNAMNKKASNIVEVDNDIKVEINFNNGFRLVRLVNEAAFKREGLLMGNCVASYFGKDCEIYSLRDVKNNPHCTIEVVRKNGKIQQVKGKGNGDVHPRYIGGVLQSLKHLKLELNPREMTYLGYESIPDYYWKFIDGNFKGVKYITFQDKRYFYKNSKLSRR